MSSFNPPVKKIKFSPSDHDDKQVVVSYNHEQVFSNDICFEIISMLNDDSYFILNTCTLISKQFLNVIKERLKLVIKFSNKFEERIELFKKSQFINNIVDFRISFAYNPIIIIELIKIASTMMKHLTFLNVSYCEINDQILELIVRMKLLKSLYFVHNDISNCVEGLKLISEMKQLTLLDISENEIGSDRVKFISELKNLRSLNIKSNQIGDKGCKSISELKNLTYLDVRYNRIGDEGCKSISELKNITFLNINGNEFSLKGAKFISEMKSLTPFNHDNRHDEESEDDM